MPNRRTVRALAALSSRECVALAGAAIELAIARFRLRSDRARDLVRSHPETRFSPVDLSSRDLDLVDEVGVAIRRLATRLPWRADCLVQALAAERWLGRRGISSKLHIGVRKDSRAALEAHAWLEVGGRIVTGGESAGFDELSR